MADAGPETLEHRLAIVEAQLQQAKECVRGFEEWQKRLQRTCIITASGAVALLFILGQIVPASGNGPTIFKGPVYFEDAAGKKLVAINDPTIHAGLGGYIDAWNNGGAHVARIGASGVGTGTVDIIGDQYVAYMTVDPSGPVLRFDDGHKKMAELAEGSDEYGMGLRIFNSGSNEVASLGTNTHKRGLLELSDENANIRVEAGTGDDGSAIVKVAGAEGKCLAIGPIACELMSR